MAKIVAAAAEAAGIRGAGSLGSALDEVRQLRAAPGVISKSAIFLPSQLRVVGLAVQSNELAELNAVSPDAKGVCEGFALGRFDVLRDQCRPVQLDATCHKRLTAASPLGHLDVADFTHQMSQMWMPIDEVMRLLGDVMFEVLEGGTLDCFVFWIDTYESVGASSDDCATGAAADSVS